MVARRDGMQSPSGHETRIVPAEQRFERTHGDTQPDIVLETLLIISRRVAPAIDLKTVRKKEPCFYGIVQVSVRLGTGHPLTDFETPPADGPDGLGQHGGIGTTNKISHRLQPDGGYAYIRP